MCARKLSRENREDGSAIDEKIEAADVADQTASRMLRMQLPWKDWIIRDFFRYWYALLALTLNIFLTLTLLQAYNIRDLLGIMEILILMLALIILEIMIYLKIWPGGIFLKK